MTINFAINHRVL